MRESTADTIRILVATDNHVGYAEDDPVRGNDGWRTFDEILSIAESRDVDMVLLGGDLFHDHQPSRKALYHVMESLRKHCLGNKPCSVDIIGDESEHFRGQFNYANYNDPNLNVSIPVFSIHGNHDEPTGQDSLASLDILQTAGLINYFGVQPEADKIAVKPILMQKGTTKLAMYGLSNVRDERLFQIFRSKNANFLQPSVYQDEWYNLLAVHQNRTAHHDQGYLPETFLPSYMDMVIWGHEHECLIEPVENPTKGFKVIQPGSSIATSLSPSEAVSKHVCILHITGKECKSEPILLKTIRPFVYKDIVLSDNKDIAKIAHSPKNIDQIKLHCKRIVEAMIKKANNQWLQQHQDDAEEDDEPLVPPKPLLRLRVDYSPPPGGGEFQIEQPRRFAKEYSGIVANDTDLFQFHKKRAKSQRNNADVDLPDGDLPGVHSADTLKISDFVSHCLNAQDLTLLPCNYFGDVVSKFVEGSDANAIKTFVTETMKASIDDLVGEDKLVMNDGDDRAIEREMNRIRERQEERFRNGELRAPRGVQTRPEDWDSDKDGPFVAGQQDTDGDRMLLDSDDPSEADSTARGPKGKGKGKAKTTTARKTTAKKPAAKTAPAKKPAARSRKKAPIEDDSDDDVEIIENGTDSGGLFVSQTPSAPTRQAPARAAASRPSTQTQLSFGRTTNGTPAAASSSRAPPRRYEPVDEEIDDDDDAFEAPVAPVRRHR